MKYLTAVTVLLCSLSALGVADAREWKDITGRYSIEAELIGFSDEAAILQRENGELGAIDIEQLSVADREFLQTKEATSIHEKNLGELQTWTTRNGIGVPGRIVDYVQRDVTVQRRRGKVYVNNLLYDNLPDIYQQILLKVIEHFEGVEFADEREMRAWVAKLRGIPKTYQVEGVIMELENGDEYGVPFFLFSEKDREVLKPGWEAWQAAKEDYEQRDDHSFRLQSLAAAYHRDQQIRRQIAVMNLNMQAIQAGITSAWEVTLYPVAGNPNPPRWVVVLGRNSDVATRLALQQNPGFVSGAVRRVSR